ncbi:MAG TPA: IPT/TIG domain-containing protein, partial [Thermoanaerobaculia bacterium]
MLRNVVVALLFAVPLFGQQMQPVLQLTPNTGRAGTTLEVKVNARLDPAASITFEPAGLAASNIRLSPNQESAAFTLTIAAGARPGPYTLIYDSGANLRAMGPRRQPNAFTVLAQNKPAIRDVQPPTVTIGAPRVELRITGANFQPGLRIDAGRGVDANVTRVTPTLIVGTVLAAPTATPGRRNVVVHNPDGSNNADAPGQLLLVPRTAAPPPDAKQIAPASITAGTMVPVVITGEGFVQGLRVTIGNGVTAAVTAVTPTQINAALASEATAAAGTRMVAVTNSDGGSDPTPLQITVVQKAPELPRIDRITPSSFTPGSSVPVTLAGVHFQPGLTLAIGDGVTATVTSATATQISATFTIAPNARPGARPVVVKNRDGSSNANQPPPQITVVAPEGPRVRSVTPRTIAPGATVPVVIAGENFRAGGKVTFGGEGLRFTAGAIASGTINGTLTADPAAAPGVRTVTVTNPDGASSPPDPAAQITVTGAERKVPVIVSITPPSVSPAQTNVAISIVGAGFQQGATVSIAGSGIAVRNVRVDSATAIAATIDVAKTAEAGPRVVVVRNPDGTSTDAQQPQPRIVVTAPEVPRVDPRVDPRPEPRLDPRLAPRVDLVTPRNIDPGAPVTLTLQGANFTPGMTLSFGRDVTVVGAVIVRSPRDASVTVLAAPAVAAGTRTVSVSSPAGSASGPGSVLINSAAPPAAPGKVQKPVRPNPIDLTPLPAKRPLPKGDIILEAPLDPESQRCVPGSASECAPEVLTLDTVFRWRETNPGIADYFKIEIIDPYGKVLVSAQTKQRHYRMTSALMASLPPLDPTNVRKSGTPRRPKKQPPVTGGEFKPIALTPLTRAGLSEGGAGAVALATKPMMPGGGVGQATTFIDAIPSPGAWQDRPGIAYWRVIGFYDERDVNGKRSGNYVPVEQSGEEGIILPLPPTGAGACDAAVSSANVQIASRNTNNLPARCDGPGQHCAGEDIMLSGTIDLSRVPFDVGSSMAAWPPKPVKGKKATEAVPSSVNFSNVFIDWGDGTEPERLSVASTAIASASSVGLSTLANYDKPAKGEVGIPLRHRYKQESPQGGYSIRIYSVSDPDRTPAYNVADAGYKLASGRGGTAQNTLDQARKLMSAPTTHLLACTKVNIVDPPGASEQDGLHLIAAAVEWPSPYDATPEPKVSACAEALRPRARIDYWGAGRVRVSWLINGDTTPLEQTELTLSGVSKASGEARKMPRLERLTVALPLSASASANTLVVRVEMIDIAPAPAPAAPSGSGKSTGTGGGSLYGSRLSGSLYSLAEVNTVLKAGSPAPRAMAPDLIARLRLAPPGDVPATGPMEISSAPRSYSIVPAKTGEVCRLVYPTTLGDFVITDIAGL